MQMEERKSYLKTTSMLLKDSGYSKKRKGLIEDVKKEKFLLEVTVRKPYYFFNIFSVLMMNPNQVQGYEFVLMQKPYAQVFNTGLEDALASCGTYEVTFVKYKGNYKYHIGGLRYLGGYDCY